MLLPAVAAHQIIGLNPFYSVAFHIDNFTNDFVIVLLKRFKNRIVADLHSRGRSHVFVQYRIEIRLGDPKPAFRTVRRTRIRIAVRRMIEAGDLITGHACDEQIISRVIGRITRLIPHLIGNAPATQMLARAGIGEVGGWKIDSAVSLLDDQAANAAVGEINR